MKRAFLLLCATLLAVAVPLAPVRADDSVPVDFFYDALSPYGDWVYTPDYGYVWQPNAAQQPGWAPYADGSWAYTDAGWTWVSNEDFGWVTYHYGRWIRLLQNWFWVPGYDWAPAWVSWRQTQGQIGWAPLPPEAAWAPDIGFGNWTDSYYDVGPACYNFVPLASFASRTSLRPFILDRSRNFNFYQQSVNVTHTSYRKNAMNHIFVGGPDPQRIDRLGGNQVRRLTLRRDDEGFRRDWQQHRSGGSFPRNMGARSRIEHDEFIVAAPTIRREASHALPARVREALHQPQVDRGWHGAADVQGAEHLRQQQHEELARTRPPNLPDKNRQPATSTAPPPAFGRTLEPHERMRNGGPPLHGAPPHAGEEARSTTPPPASMPHREHDGRGLPPARRPGETKTSPSRDIPRQRPDQPTAPSGGQSQPPPHTDSPKAAPSPSQKTPAAPPAQRGVPGQQRHEPRHAPAEPPPGQPPAAPRPPPRFNPAPIPPQPPRSTPPVQPLPPQRGNAPPMTPVTPPHHATPPNAAPHRKKH